MLEPVLQDGVGVAFVAVVNLNACGAIHLPVGPMHLFVELSAASRALTLVAAAVSALHCHLDSSTSTRNLRHLALLKMVQLARSPVVLPSVLPFVLPSQPCLSSSFQH